MNSNRDIPEDIRGFLVESTEGSELGHVMGAYADAEGKQRAAVVAFHDSSKRAVVPLAGVSFRGGTLRVGYTEEAVRSTPEVEIGEPLREEAVKKIDNHFSGMVQRATSYPYRPTRPPSPLAYPYRPALTSSLGDFIQGGEGLTYRPSEKQAPHAERG